MEKKNDIYSLIPYIILLIAGVVTASEVGSLTELSLNYAVRRGDVVKSAFIILICIVFSFLADRIIAGNQTTFGVSPVIADICTFVLGIMIYMILLRQYTSGNVKVMIMAMITFLIVHFMSAKNLYMDGMDGVDDGKSMPMGDEDELEGDELASQDKNGTSEAGTDKSFFASGGNTSEDVNNSGIELSDASNDNSDDIELSDASNSDSTDENVDVSNDSSDDKYSDGNASSKTNIAKNEGSEEDVEENEVVDAESGESVGLSTEIFHALAAVLTILVGVLMMSSIYTKDNGGTHTIIIVLASAVAIMFRLLGRGAEKKRSAYIEISLIISLFLCYMSMLAGFIYMLKAFASAVLVPIVLENWGTGGWDAIRKKKIVLASLVGRVLTLIIILVAVWQLSYGAIWEVDFLAIIAAVAYCYPVVEIRG